MEGGLIHRFLHWMFPSFSWERYNAGLLDGKSDPNVQKQSERVGYRRGWTRALELAPKAVTLEIKRDDLALPEARKSIYGPDFFEFDSKLRDQMIGELRVLDKNKKLSMPNPEQMAMIFARNPATCVIAGAGSGKSTTLGLRVIFMLKYLEIDIKEITVVSFTKASCKELRKKLSTLFQLFDMGVPSEETLEQLVRTFHSGLYRANRMTFGKTKYFEMLRNEKEKIDDDEDVDNPLSSAKLNDLQVEILKEVHQKLYLDNSIYKDAIDELFKIQNITRSTRAAYGDELIALAGARDRNLVELVNKRWRDDGRWDASLLDPAPPDLHVVVKNQIFFAKTGLNGHSEQ